MGSSIARRVERRGFGATDVFFEPETEERVSLDIQSYGGSEGGVKPRGDRALADLLREGHDAAGNQLSVEHERVAAGGTRDALVARSSSGEGGEIRQRRG